MDSSDRPVLIVDGMNAFIRSWAAFPTMSAHGYQMGGCIGFLKSLRKLVNEIQPKAIYVAWEGGGSSRRRKIYADYKMGRRPEKLNRFYEDDIPDTEENRKHQLVTLLGMLKCIPVCQLYVADCEGDDLVAYLCTGPLKDEDKIIVSSDKDLYQLLGPKTRLYSLHKKTYILEENVLEDFRVRAQNFALAKTLCGDRGDNVPGIKGVGFKTIARLFPFLGTENNIILQDVLDYAASHEDESAVFKRIIENEADVRRNWRLVYLDGSMLSATQMSSVDHVIKTFVPTVDRVKLVRLLVAEGIGDFDIEGFFYVFNCIDGLQKRVEGK